MIQVEKKTCQKIELQVEIDYGARFENHRNSNFERKKKNQEQVFILKNEKGRNQKKSGLKEKLSKNRRKSRRRIPILSEKRKAKSRSFIFEKKPQKIKQKNCAKSGRRIHVSFRGRLFTYLFTLHVFPCSCRIVHLIQWTMETKFSGL